MRHRKPSSVLRCLALFAGLGTTGCSLIQSFDDFYVDGGAGSDMDAGMGRDATSEVDAYTAMDAGPTVDASQDASVDGDGGLTAERFIDEFSRRSCQKALDCETKLGLGVLLEVFCHPGLVSLFITDFPFSGADGTVFDAGQGEICLASLDDPDCTVRNALFGAGCDTVFQPTLAVGERCTISDQCIGGRCEESTTACGGVCEALVPRDGACDNNSACVEPLACIAGRCVTKSNANGPCDESGDCGSLLYCDSGSDLCTIVPNVGQDCRPDLGGDPCAGALVCRYDGVQRTCTVGALEGESCSSRIPCDPGLRCSETTNRCVTLSPPGGACSSLENCPAFHECVGRVCTPRPVLGGSCTPLLPCLIGICRDGSCGYPDPGLFCTEDLQCEFGCIDPGDGARVCADPTDVGGGCSDDRQCVTGSECVGTIGRRLCTGCE